MIYLQLFYEFFKTGLFAVGGGLAAEHGTPVSAQELAPVYLRISQAERERNARLQQEATQK